MAKNIMQNVYGYSHQLVFGQNPNLHIKKQKVHKNTESTKSASMSHR